MIHQVLLATLQWLAFPLVALWILLVHIPWRFAKWLIFGETPSQREYGEKRWKTQQADWANIEARLEADLKRLGLPDTAKNRSMLLSIPEASGRRRKTRRSSRSQ